MLIHLPRLIVGLSLLSAVGPAAWSAELSLPNIFSDSMVLQRDQPNPIWGWCDANEKVSLEIDGKRVECTANGDGAWRAELPALETGGPYDLKISTGDEKREIADILAGEVWLCSGQSNMEWPVERSENFELEKLAAKYPQIRMINFPNTGTQEPIKTHPDSKWMTATAEQIGAFSAVGYFFGRQLHQTLGVPIGLVNNSWGGSAAEAWVDPEGLEKSGKFDDLLQQWQQSEERYKQLQSAAEEQRDDAQRKQLTELERRLSGNQRPGNIYHGVLSSHRGYGVRGAIWYQGESNAGRAYQYRELFPLMIENMRESWGQNDFPFYWVQLADFRQETDGPSESDWAELREAQTMTLDRLENVGQAVIIDLGEGKDIHPRNKLAVGRRLARLALRNEYGVEIAANSPRFKQLQIKGNRAVLEFQDVGRGWRAFDVADPVGFTIAGEDRKFVPANAKIGSDNRIEVWSDAVAKPVAVRYAWADNPVVNLYNQDDLPLTPFRSDDWPGVTSPKP